MTTSSLRRLRSRWSAALLPLLLAGCATAQMEVPAPLRGTAPLAVEGRQGWKIEERLRFGAYEAVNVDRSWTKGSDLRILVYESSKRRQTFRFALTENATTAWTADCSVRLRVRGAEARGIEIVAQDRSEVECTLTPAHASGGATWGLVLSEERERPLDGILAGDGRSFVVAGTNRIQGGIVPMEGASGYVFREDDVVLGAVEVVNDGRVWLGSSQHNSLLATAAAALLLVEDLRGSIQQ